MTLVLQVLLGDMPWSVTERALSGALGGWALSRLGLLLGLVLLAGLALNGGVLHGLGQEAALFSGLTVLGE